MNKLIEVNKILHTIHCLPGNSFGGIFIICMLCFIISGLPKIKSCMFDQFYSIFSDLKSVQNAEERPPH